MLSAASAWPVPEAAAFATGLLLWPIGARLRLSPASRAATTACFAVAVVLVDAATPEGVDGRAAFLLAAAACFAVGGRVRAGVALLCVAGAVVLTPAVGLGVGVLVVGLVLRSELLTRWPRPLRWVAAGTAVAGAVAAAVAVVSYGPPVVAPVALTSAALLIVTLLVVAVLWRRQPWLRAAGVATAALAACSWFTDGDGTVVVVAAAVAVLTVVLLDEYASTLAPRVAAAAVVTAMAGVGLLAPGAVTAPRRAGPSSVGQADPVSAAAVTDEPGERIRPVSISIPALAVSGPLEDLPADPVTGELAAPEDPAVAGWFAAGVVPGDIGPAVVGGHVDSRTGPGVFFRLGTLAQGDRVEVVRSDGTTVEFTVTDVRRFPKDRFPTDAVYGPSPGPELRLVTCGGTFDRRTRSYDDNIVVDAVLSN